MMKYLSKFFSSLHESIEWLQRNTALNFDPNIWLFHLNKFSWDFPIPQQFEINESMLINKSFLFFTQYYFCHCQINTILIQILPFIRNLKWCYLNSNQRLRKSTSFSFCRVHSKQRTGIIVIFKYHHQEHFNSNVNLPKRELQISQRRISSLETRLRKLEETAFWKMDNLIS